MTTSRTKTTSRAKTASRVQSPAPSAPAAPIRLSDAALLLLGQAAAREDRLLLPPPPALRARGSALQKVLQALLEAGLVTEVPVANEAQSWRSGDDGQRIGLVIAAEGFRAIGLPVPAPAAPAAAPAMGQGDPPAAEVAGRITKQAVLIALLSDEAGASVPALAETLAWQNHTVRAALTGLRQKGHQLARTKDAAGTTVYRITGQAGADAAGATGAAATTGA
jgi:predicted transcriptional regulator